MLIDWLEFPRMGKYRQARLALHVVGWRGVVQVAVDRVSRRGLGFGPRIAAALDHAFVLEVGGPSALFRGNGPVPVYGYSARVDNINYAGATLWESGLSDGGPFAPGGQELGTQWLREATDVGDIGPYDAVVSSHTIEHTANPLRALREWKRICRDGGFLLLVVPHRDGTFDHRRPLTPLEHLRNDELVGMDEDDRTHVAEILELHDVSRDPGLSSTEQLKERTAQNLKTRAMHHHVFSTHSALEMVAEAGWVPLEAQARWPHDIVILARNGGAARQVTISSPFPTDRRPPPPKR